MSQHPKMLCHSWQIYFILEINDIRAEAALLIKSFSYEGVTILACPTLALEIK